MRGTVFLVAGVAIALAGCAHPEDRRWISMTPRTADALPPDERPTVMVYGFSPPKPDAAKPSIKDYSDRGQAALITALAASSADPAALRKALATPIVAGDAGGPDDRSKIACTIVISIGKGPASQPGDRLVRTIVTITPVGENGGTAPFEFAGYTVAATDNKVQSIAHLEDQTDLSLKGSLAPKIGGFGDNGIEASAGRTRKSTADIAQQYENLNVDISPGQLIVTRESERGLDVVGNTLIALTLSAPQDANVPQAFAVTAQKLFDADNPLPPGKAKLVLSPLRMLARRDLQVDVQLRYVLRRITSGREYYTEGKQRVELVSGSLPAPEIDPATSRPTSTPLRQTLVRAADAQPPLYVVCLKAQGHPELMAQPVDDDPRPLTYDSLGDAKSMIAWLAVARPNTIGDDGTSLVVVKDRPLPASGYYYAMPFADGCNPKVKRAPLK